MQGGQGRGGVLPVFFSLLCPTWGGDPPKVVLTHRMYVFFASPSPPLMSPYMGLHSASEVLGNGGLLTHLT